MLVWPLDTKTGAVHISNGDFKRLEPQEFLNDTLIEFGLKLWFQNFSEKHPEVARDVHMFNTFFYKKISNKDFKAGYESVKKWTNKVNIFSKKYIIVPINEHLHWYLAIIYNPRGILRPPLPAAIRTPRKSARLSMAKPSPEPVEVSTPTSEQSSGAVDEAEVELQVEDVNMEDADTTPFAVSDRGPSEHQVDYMEVDSPREMPPVTVANREVSPELGEALPVRHTDKQAPTIMAPQPPPEALYIPEVSDVGDEETFIFTFDSLGGPHKGAIKFLSRYLQAEAEHKLEKRETREGIGKKARVPIQQNFCDCGLFVLHFVEKFMEKPEEFIREFLVNEKKSAEKKPVDYWDRMWDREAVNDKRNLLKAEIESLASEWKQRKEAHAQDEAQKGKEKEASVMPSGEDTAQGSKSDEDSDVEIVGESRKTLPTRGGKKGQVDNRRGVATARVAAATPEELRRSRGENDHRHAGPQARAVSRAADEPSQEVTAVPGPAESAKIRAQRPTPRLPLNGNRFIRK
ncbi:hypothetical protein CALVIDRAFT_246204 [Calocera viscosa TUFC12733]|uniref:Ubiquitin-like protease family profile domain-containing protein n=1 Tax=Calocera viscosa (strain TUFC12733) TaxID=1330018 RepID=A0A167JIK3_CALVF|nr:hypothetical protein CALVIDRAFT_246204 [Calocera viscosa TUFC12733]